MQCPVLFLRSAGHIHNINIQDNSEVGSAVLRKCSHEEIMLKASCMAQLLGVLFTAGLLLPHCVAAAKEKKRPLIIAHRYHHAPVVTKVVDIDHNDSLSYATCLTA